MKTTNAPVVDVVARPTSIAKRALDIVLAAVGLMVLAPLLLVIALLIRFDTPGPIIFRQWRVGRGGGPFEM